MKRHTCDGLAQAPGTLDGHGRDAVCPSELPSFPAGAESARLLTRAAGGKRHPRLSAWGSGSAQRARSPVPTRTLTINQEAAMAAFPPITHVAVTVTDLERSTRWYGALLAAGPVLDEDERAGGFHHTVFALGGGQLLGLHTHHQAAGDTFDEHRTGLDHIAFACRDRDELQAWAARLDELGIAHGGIKDAHYGSGVSFRDPDGIALEFFAPPA